MQTDESKTTDYIGNFVYENDKLQYASTSVGRTVWNLDTVKEEYFVKDHLGNVRSIIDVYHYPIMLYLASYEIASAQLEGLFFDKVEEIRDDKPGSSDPEDTKAGRLNGAEPESRIGTSILVKVMAGDQVKLNVDNYYDGTYNQADDQPVNPEDMLNNIIATLTGGEGGLGESESHNPDLVPQLFNPENYTEANDLMHSEAEPDRPKAFLNYVLFDENMQVVSNFTGAWQANGNGSWQTIGNMEPMRIPLNGYLAVYVSSATNFEPCGHCNPSEGDVFFDKVKIRLTKGNLKQENHYYPYGLAMAGLGGSDLNMTRNRQRYQGNEYITDAGLNWMYFHNRQYDPQLGRFLSVDPLAGYGNQDRFSPYAAMWDAPAIITDPLGLDGDNTTPPYFEGKKFLPSGSDVGTTTIVGYLTPDFSIRNFFGAINAGGYWGSTGNGKGGNYGGGVAGGTPGRGAYTSAVNSEGTLQSLTQSIGDNANENPDVATGGEGENGYNTNYEGETGGDGNEALQNLKDITDLLDKGTIIPQTGIGFANETKLGRLLSSGTTEITEELIQDMKLVKPLARGLEVVNIVAVGVAVSNDISEGHYKSATARAVVYGIAAGAVFIPFVGWGLSAGIGIADAIWGDEFYDYIENNW